MTEPTILEKYEALPEFLKTEVSHYIEFLLEKYVNPTLSSQPEANDENQEKLEKSHGYGSMAGQIIVSDDFDEPLEDFDENQENLEKSHGYESWAGQIIVSDDFDEPLEDLKEYM